MTALEGTFHNAIPGNAEDQFAVRTDSGTLATFFWANDCGPLPDYLPIKALPITDGYACCSISNGLMIPHGATHMLASVSDIAAASEPRACSCEIPVYKQTPAQKPLYRFVAASDTHALAKKARDRHIRAACFADIAQLNPAYLLFAGDVTNGMQAKEFISFADDLLTAFHDIPVFTAFGNHDFNPNAPHDRPSAEARDAFFRRVQEHNAALGADACSAGRYGFSTRYDGLQLVSLDCVQGKSDYRVDDDQLQWLDNTLRQSEADRFRIVLNHFPLRQHVLGSRPHPGKQFLRNDHALQKLLNTHARIMYLSGHTHYRPDSDYCSAEFVSETLHLYINTGSIGNTQPCTADCRALRSMRNVYLANAPDSTEQIYIEGCFKSRSMGQVIEVFADSVAVKGRDFLMGKYIPRCSFRFPL